jgi:hypothetical protein
MEGFHIKKAAARSQRGYFTQLASVFLQLRFEPAIWGFKKQLFYRPVFISIPSVDI